MTPVVVLIPCLTFHLFESLVDTQVWEFFAHDLKIRWFCAFGDPCSRNLFQTETYAKTCEELNNFWALGSALS